MSEMLEVADALEEFAMIDEAEGGNPLVIATERRAAELLRSHASLVEEVERLRDALKDMLHAVCGETGFANAVRHDSGFEYPWPALDIAEEKARKALEKSNA